MLKLSDLSTKNYIDYGLYAMKRYGTDTYKVQVLLNYNITNYEELRLAIESKNPVFQEPALMLQLHEAQKELSKLNASVRTFQTFSFPTYYNSGFNPTILENTDKEVTASVLPSLTSIMVTTFSLPVRLQEYTIFEVKKLLGLLSLSGRNAFASCNSSIGIAKITKIAQMIEFYEAQILRVAATIPNLDEYDGNLFTKDSKRKEEVVQDLLSKIVTYLTNNSDEFIWGKLNPSQKEKLLSISISANTKQEKIIRRNIINLIRNYTTLEELESEEQRPIALKRFIKDKNQ